MVNLQGGRSVLRPYGIGQTQRERSSHVCHYKTDRITVGHLLAKIGHYRLLVRGNGGAPAVTGVLEAKMRVFRPGANRQSVKV